MSRRREGAGGKRKKIKKSGGRGGVNEKQGKIIRGEGEGGRVGEGEVGRGEEERRESHTILGGGGGGES